MSSPEQAERRPPAKVGGARTDISDRAKVPVRRARSKQAAPAAFVSLLLPAGRRTWYAYLVRCRTCGAPHLGRSRDLTGVTRVRRLPCGHAAEVMIARTYEPPGAAS